MRLLRKLAGGVGRLLDASLIPNWRLSKFPQAKYMELLLKTAKVDCVFDVGANAGQFRDFLRQEVGYPGMIVSFEPIPELAEAMRERATRDPAWTIECCALGPTPRSAKFNVMQGNQFSSFLEPRDAGSHLFGKRNSVERVIDVEVQTLDARFLALEQRLKFKTPYLKMDTQGFDLEVVAGAKQSINRFVGLQTEASVSAIYDEMPDFGRTQSEIGALGFSLSAIFPNNPGHFPELIEFDCHFVASRHIAELRARYLESAARG